ncbi:MAG: prepilin-type N-terminal cleavage/methylation domain-containing protein [Patescibacteria group bacterium]
MRKYGFTLIELLIVITILVTVLGLGIASFTTFNRRERLKQTALTLKSYLRFSQTKAISAQKPLSGCTTYQGMHISFTSTSYSMQHQCIPEGVVGSSESITLPVGVTFSPIPSAFTFLTRSNTDTIITDTAIRLTNGILSYSLVISPNGGVRVIGF